MTKPIQPLILITMKITIKGFGVVSKEWAEKEVRTIASNIEGATENDLIFLTNICRGLREAKTVERTIKIEKMFNHYYSAIITVGAASRIAYYLTSERPKKKQVFRDYYENKKPFFIIDTEKSS